MTTFISGIPNDRIDDVWDSVKGFIEMGNSKSRQEMGIEDIYEKLINRDILRKALHEAHAKQGTITPNQAKMLHDEINKLEK